MLLKTSPVFTCAISPLCKEDFDFFTWGEYYATYSFLYGIERIGPGVIFLRPEAVEHITEYHVPVTICCHANQMTIFRSREPFEIL